MTIKSNSIAYSAQFTRAYQCKFVVLHNLLRCIRYTLLCSYILHNAFFFSPLFIACRSLAHQDFFSLIPSLVLNSYMSAPMRNCRQDESLETALLYPLTVRDIASIDRSSERRLLIFLLDSSTYMSRLALKLFIHRTQ